jgi:hypothetical protein
MLQFGPMIIFLPMILVFLVCLFLFNFQITDSWRHSFLRSILLCGGYAILSLEVLSLFHAITQVNLFIIWGFPVIFISSVLIRRARSRGGLHLPTFPGDFRWHEWLLLITIILCLLTTLIVALISPPQTYDSLNYHMPRVAHWWQARSVGFFATGIEKQNIYPPGAEMLVLHFYTLSGGDSLVNLVAWFAYVSAGIAASLIASRLGATRSGQWFATAFVYATPMAIAQASSTMTDIVAGLWLCCVAAEVVVLWKSTSLNWSPFFTGIAAGLTILTKPTVLPYLAMFGVLYLILIVKKFGVQKSIINGLIALVVILIINMGFWVRNFEIYGNLTDPGTVSSFSSAIKNPAMVASNILRNAGLEVWTPWPRLNAFLYEIIYKIHIKMGVALDDPASTFAGVFQIRTPSWSEDLISNPLSAVICLVTGMTILVWIRRGSQATCLYALTLVAGFVLYSAIFKWQIFAGRLLLPFFMVYAPVCGYAFGRLRPPFLSSLSGIILLGLSWPALTGIASRPLIPNEGSNLAMSILYTPRQELRYANIQGQRQIEEQIVDMIDAVGCRQVGLSLQGDGAEYPIWVLLGAPDHSLHIEWMVAGTPSAKLEDVSFEPCAVICTTCTEDKFRELPVVLDQAGLRLYLESQ